MMSFMSIQGSRQYSMIFFYAGYLNISVEWIILDNSNHSSTESFCIVWGRLMASEKQYLILLQWNSSEVNRTKGSKFDLRLSLQKNDAKNRRFDIVTGVLLCCLYRKEDFCCWRKNWDCSFCFFLIASHYWDRPNITTTILIWHKENTQPKIISHPQSTDLLG